MPKSNNPSQQQQRLANGANGKPVSESTRKAMAKKIRQLNEQHGFTFAQISEAMGRKGGYSHLVLDGSRCKPTDSDMRGLNGMWYAVTTADKRTRNETEKRIKAIGLLAEAMRMIEEL